MWLVDTALWLSEEDHSMDAPKCLLDLLHVQMEIRASVAEVVSSSPLRLPHLVKCLLWYVIFWTSRGLRVKQWPNATFCSNICLHHGGVHPKKDPLYLPGHSRRDFTFYQGLSFCI